ncbi:MAG: SDR family oxidoreductase [Elusimicrobiota bacterium]|jgi:NAD(P)-dependent dehydrogenase (short-subunit alcohol dehydrogenase family)
MKTIDQRFNLKNKVVVVIGGAGHLCSTLGRAMAESGMKVCVLDRPEAPDKDRSNYPMTYWKCDATSKADLDRCCAEILKKYKRVDVLLNGAGVNAPTPFLDIQTDEMDRILQSHLYATLYASQVFGAAMLKQKSGSIINFASASSGPPLSKAFIYSIAKAGIANLTQNLAREWATQGVRVNALRPGFFPTQWSMKHFIDADRKKSILGHTPMGRFGKPEELIGATLWLASDAASFVTGSLVAVDGGFTAMTI